MRSQRFTSRLPTTERRMGVAKGFSEKIFFYRILGPIPDVIYRGDHSGGSMSAFAAGKSLDREAFDRLVPLHSDYDSLV